ncbi:competence protein ComFA [Breznakia sp. PF5-3]|uniref:helicase-related protein n=1 Tax=unclassified Breznakia TaxID=2623764 RepID=UPI00240554E4|nr:MULTISPECIES: helicase-related protein [unclassified Breznakia]MDF9824557.1 competence protein ComFA [Breznakia sp. PM6-1]MDF9835447.1 competence protein ComFA [Breznakia sp. PF5-3]
MVLECKRCGARDKQYFYTFKQQTYCRRCIQFGKMNIGEEVKAQKLSQKSLNVQYTLAYDLTTEQEKIVHLIRKNRKEQQKILIYAACGAGKTEITMESIETYLCEGKKVGYAIARRQVVLEIAERFRQAFPNIKVTQVCAGYTSEIDGDIIVCTMHQLYRYPKVFDLLILDEIDAFPYAGNPLLERIAEQACRGEMLLLTATPDQKLKQQVQQKEILQFTLFKRPHGYPLVEPKVKVRPTTFQYFSMFLVLWKFRKQKWIVFVPTIRLAKGLYMLFKHAVKCNYITSKTLNNEKTMLDFKDGRYNLLIATTILERGITISGVNVLILHGEHIVYQESSLIQMVGRVGRKIEAPTGYAYILSTKRTKAIRACVKTIREMNQHEG